MRTRPLRSAWLWGLIGLNLVWTVASAAAPPTITAPPSRLTVTTYGAAMEVSGSLHVLDTGNARWMIDCGSVIEEDAAGPSGRVLSEKGRAAATTLPPGLEKVSALLLTHAHTDHIGRLPLLLRQGFQGPIFATEATAALTKPMLHAQLRGDRSEIRHWTWSASSLARAGKDKKSLYVHWRNCKYRQSIAAEHLQEATCSTQELFDRFNNRQPRIRVSICNECMDDEMASITERMQTRGYGQPFDLAAGVRATLLDAGHIPGSASILIEVTLGSRSRRVIFSGDLGNGLSPLQPGPRPAPEVDAAVIETTYGAVHREPAVKQEHAEFRRAVAEAVREGGVTWIPAFALDRTQKILHELREAQREELLPDPMPIYCPSPTAREVTAVYDKLRPQGWFSSAVAGDVKAWRPNDVKTTVPSAHRLPRPCIVVSTSDILIAPWMRELLAALLPEPSTRVFLVGYQDPGGAGSHLRQGVTKIQIDDREVPVRAKVRSFECFSGHGDAADIDAWLARVPTAATIILVHGEPQGLASRAEQLTLQGRRRVIVAQPGQATDLGR